MIQGILIPFIGTSLGSACVFLVRKQVSEGIEKALIGFAAGVMVAASVWSLIIPSIEISDSMGRLAFLPALTGVWAGVLFLLVLDNIISRLHKGNALLKDSGSVLRKTTMLVLAVTLHNLPEGMAVGVVYAGWLSGSAQITLMDAAALSVGIAIQNFPEGAIISMPLKAGGMRNGKAFLCGVLSGVIEPVGAVLTILAIGVVAPLLPYILGFAAGAMLYVVVEELIPEMSDGAHTNIGILSFALGFTVMMMLDVAFG